MSTDLLDGNFYLIRPDGKRFAASEGKRSTGIPTIGAKDRRFDTLDEAFEWASGEYTDYGVHGPDDIEVLKRILADPPV